MITAEEIVHLFRRRQERTGTEREEMRRIANLYAGDIVVPLPELRKDEKPAVVNIARQGINQMGMRVASVLPNIVCPPVAHGRRADAEARATTRRGILSGWWAETDMQLMLRKRGRHLFGYAHSCVMIKPCVEEGRPKWHVVSPLDCWPSQPSSTDSDVYVPRDNIIASTHSKETVMAWWPHVDYQLARMRDGDLVEVLYYVDSNEIVAVATPCLLANQMASEIVSGSWGYSGSTIQAVELERQPNFAGRPLTVMARQISLERPIGLYNGILGMYEAQAELEALSRHARRRGVFWEEWLVSRDENTTPSIEVEADAFTGQVGVVKGGMITKIAPESQYATDTGVDRMERAQRVEAGLPADFGGEAGSNIRTGARASTLVANAVDPVLQEAHEVFAKSLRLENEIAIAIDKGHWSGRTKTVWLGHKEITYRPETVWETDRHFVDYTLAGADLNQMTIVPLQLMGAGVMSRKSAMAMHPLIKDVEQEYQTIAVERVQEAVFAGVQQLLTTPGGMPITDAVRLQELLEQGAGIVVAFKTVQEEAQKRQAELAQQQSQTQPGINMPGQGAEQPGMPPAQDPLGALRQQLGNLRMINMTTPQERGVA